jgi:hypothetical protein
VQSIILLGCDQPYSAVAAEAAVVVAPAVNEGERVVDTDVVLVLVDHHYRYSSCNFILATILNTN